MPDHPATSPPGPTNRPVAGRAGHSANDPPNDPANADGDITDALVQLSFTVMGVLSRVAAEHEMSLTQLRMLGVLRDRRPRMTELARFLGLDKSTLSGLIDRAQRRGLVERSRSVSDGRVTEVAMTATGTALAERVHARVRAELDPLIAGLDARTRAALMVVQSW